MAGPEAWSDRSAVATHLAHQLLRGRVTLFLGAGVSGFYGLPEWSALVNRLCKLHSQPELSKGDDPVIKVASLRARFYKNDTPGFLRDVRAILYETASVDLERLRENRQLAAIGALVMASKRGSASQVVTFNYDDLLELYLEYHGLVAASIASERHWRSDADVTVYHPHGLMPLQPTEYRRGSYDIVFGSADYHAIMKPESLWRATLLSILRSHTTIYVGLSGVDPHLQALVSDLQSSHAVHEDRIAFHGVRFSVGPPNDDVSVFLNSYGVATLEIPNWDDLASFLFEIVQTARELRTGAR